MGLSSPGGGGNGFSGYTECVLARGLTLQTVSANTRTLISFDTEISDPVGWITVPGTTATCPAGQGGLYLVAVRFGSVAVPTLARAVVDLSIARAGQPYIAWSGQWRYTNFVWVTGITPIQVGDTVTVSPYHEETGVTHSVAANLYLYKLDILRP